MRDPQEYDTTDLLHELVDDSLNFGNMIHMWENNQFNWPRIERGFGWEHSVMRQYVEYCCGRHEDMVDDVWEQVQECLSESQPLHIVYEADNYDHINNVEELDSLMELMVIWIEEGVIKV